MNGWCVACLAVITTWRIRAGQVLHIPINGYGSREGAIPVYVRGARRVVSFVGSVCGC